MYNSRKIIDDVDPQNKTEEEIKEEKKKRNEKIKIN